jgi:hypothetical protein
MGVTKKVPKVGFNAAGQLFNWSMSSEELKFMVLAGNGMYDWCLVTQNKRSSVGSYEILLGM